MSKERGHIIAIPQTLNYTLCQPLRQLILSDACGISCIQITGKLKIYFKTT
ncbi:Uncharacterised protein [Pseudomonas putida]|nr:Uncharacterised protein [Pseudomonas putida]CAB5719897.1 Uncharacterised protein [Pseudomonas putida]